MSNSKVLLSFFLFFFFISLASSFNASHKCSPQQTLDLLLFKKNLSSINYAYDRKYYTYTSCKNWLGSDYHPIMMKWKKNTDCCRWEGVTCNHLTGDVIALDLSCGMLEGTIHPNSTLFRLPHLQTLNLAYNDFSASRFPHRFHNSLTHLNLSSCGFNDYVPKEISFLPKLVSLDLSWNYGLQMHPYFLENLLRNSSRLRELDLRDTRLQGKLPDSIFSLPYLKILDLSYNDQLTGPLPKVNGSINVPLKWLGLSYTNLSGEIPDSIGHLKSLNYLDLSSNGLVGSLPGSLLNLTHLTTLNLEDNKLSGMLPSFLFTLPLIENVFLGHNMFSGGLPSELFKCSSLKVLSLWSNQFDGEINEGSSPPSFSKLVNLTLLDLQQNNFTGVWDLKTLLSSLPNLQDLSLSYSGLSVVVSDNSFNYVNPNFRFLGLASCKLNVFPESLRAMKKLSILDLSDNNIHGRIPDWAGEINGLTTLYLSRNFITGLPQLHSHGITSLYLQSNQIQGPFPSSICNMRNLEYLDISNNSFDGVIPQCLGNISSSLVSLNVKSNQFQGPFPLSICNMNSLQTLHMSDNSFDGVIPQCLGNIIPSLWVVDMGNNRFHGTIPDVYAACRHLEGLVLNGNQLHGEVPISLSKCRSLKVFDLGNNQLNGTFPEWLSDLPMLQALVLKSNKLHGPIGNSSTNKSVFPSMQVLDLSHNRFVGHLPNIYFQNFKAMKHVIRKGSKSKYMILSDMYYSIVAVVKGVELNFPKISVDYEIVDLSNNRFEGEIPGMIGSLTWLIVLNLSHNHLTGQIPSALGNLSEIESLDLSWNRLTGEIPQSLADITNLEVLNLSQNHLNGRIPSGKQFNTFEEDSFGGNPELCGFPLPKKCEHPREPHLEEDGDADEESGFTWRVVMLGYGCGTLIGLVMGYVMLSTGRPKWFIAIADAIEHMIRSRGNKRRYLYIGK